MKHRNVFPLLLIFQAIPAWGQISEPKLTTATIASRAAVECAVPPAFVSVEQDSDGTLHYQMSPTLSRSQRTCLVNALGKLGVYRSRS
jgi:hypothetical protein